MSEAKRRMIAENQNLLDNDLTTIRDVVNKHENVRERANKYVYQLITIFGLVAGFGFTALGHVKVIYLFIVGEFLFFVAIGVGVVFVKKAFIDEADTYANYIKKLGQAIDQRTGIDWVNEKEGEIREKMDKVKQEELVVFDDKPAKLKSELIFNLMYIFFFLGCLFLLVSLINIDLSLYWLVDEI